MALAAIPVLALLAGGCLWPIDYQAEMDASSDYPPVIISSTPRMPGEISGNPPTAVPTALSAATPRAFEITVNDRDIGDTLTVRVFRNYVGPDTTGNFPSDEIQVANDPVTGTVTRPPISLTPNWWCKDLAVNTQVLIDVVVSDRPFVTDRRSWELAGTDGAKSKGSWWVVCLE